jgi:hypothetical protein
VHITQIRLNESQARTDKNLARTDENLRSLIALVDHYFREGRNAVAIPLSSYLYLSACAGRALKAPEIARFSNTILKSFAHPQEGGAARVFCLSKEALSAIPSNGSIDLDGHRYTFPLPKYAFRLEKSAGRFHFLAFVSPDEMQKYFDRDLPQAGWMTEDQMGAGHFLQNQNAHMIVVQHFYLTSDISEFEVLINDRS